MEPQMTPKRGQSDQKSNHKCHTEAQSKRCVTVPVGLEIPELTGTATRRIKGHKKEGKSTMQSGVVQLKQPKRAQKKENWLPLLGTANLILILYDFSRFQFWPQSDFCSTNIRNDHLKTNPHARLYPMSILPAPHGHFFVFETKY